MQNDFNLNQLYNNNFMKTNYKTYKNVEGIEQFRDLNW